MLYSLFENLYTTEPIDLTLAMCSLMGLFIHVKRGHAQYCITLIESIEERIGVCSIEILVDSGPKYTLHPNMEYIKALMIQVWQKSSQRHFES